MVKAYKTPDVAVHDTNGKKQPDMVAAGQTLGHSVELDSIEP